MPAEGSEETHELERGSKKRNDSGFLKNVRDLLNGPGCYRSSMRRGEVTKPMRPPERVPRLKDKERAKVKCLDGVHLLSLERGRRLSNIEIRKEVGGCPKTRFFSRWGGRKGVYGKQSDGFLESDKKKGVEWKGLEGGIKNIADVIK